MEVTDPEQRSLDLQMAGFMFAALSFNDDRITASTVVEDAEFTDPPAVDVSVAMPGGVMKTRLIVTNVTWTALVRD